MNYPTPLGSNDLDKVFSKGLSLSIEKRYVKVVISANECISKNTSSLLSSINSMYSFVKNSAMAVVNWTITLIMTGLYILGVYCSFINQPGLFMLTFKEFWVHWHILMSLITEYPLAFLLFGSSFIYLLGRVFMYVSFIYSDSRLAFWFWRGSYVIKAVFSFLYHEILVLGFFVIYFWFMYLVAINLLLSAFFSLGICLYMNLCIYSFFILKFVCWKPLTMKVRGRRT